LDYQPAISVWLIALFAVCGIFSLVVNGTLFRWLYLEGGKVVTEVFGPSDSGLACFFVTWFVWLTYTGFATQQRAVTDSDLITGAFHVTVIVLVIVLFLVSRKINLSSQFGLNRNGVSKAIFFAAPLLLTAFPLVAWAGFFMGKVMGDRADPQELVRFFTDASRAGKIETMIFTMLFGVLVAPAAEEFIFRGYLYATAKKYLGFIPAMILVSALFAAIHLNLFILAICFTLAYESTGSILVPMAMHALFNFSEFALMLAPSHLQP